MYESYGKQLDLLINMAQDEQDHVAPSAAIFAIHKLGLLCFANAI